jgi:hypothetical protein
MSFEKPSNCVSEKTEPLDDNLSMEVGTLRKLAKSPMAKKMVIGLGLMTGIITFSNKAEAGFGAILKKIIAENIQGPVKEELENYKEYGRKAQQNQRNYERTQYKKGRATALEEIKKYGKPKISSWGSRRTDRNQDEFYQGYMSVVRRWEREQNRKVINAHRKKGRIEGGERFNNNLNR